MGDDGEDDAEDDAMRRMMRQVLRSRRAMIWQVIIGILLLASVALVFKLFIDLKKSSNEPFILETCKASHALRVANNFYSDNGLLRPKTGLDALIPLACKTIRHDRPGTSLVPQGRDTEAQQEWVINKLLEQSVKTWGTHLGGRYRGLFAGAVGGKDECFIQYITMFKETRHFSRDTSVPQEALQEAIDTRQKEIIPQADGCDRNNPARGTGGMCIPKDCTCGDECPDADEVYGEKPERFTNSKPGRNCPDPSTQQCCIARNTCEHQGGKCVSRNENPVNPCYSYDLNVEIDHPQWYCPDVRVGSEVVEQVCCVDQSQQITFAEYFDHAGGGDGKVIINIRGGRIVPNKPYAIAFISPIKNACDKSLTCLGISAAVGAGTGLYTKSQLAGYMAFGTSILLAEMGGAALAWLFENDFSTLYIGDLSDVQQHCNTERGLEET